MQNGKSVVEGDHAKHNQRVRDEEEQSLFDLKPIPKMYPMFGPGADDPSTSAQGHRVHYPEMQGGQPDGQGGIGQRQPQDELICKAP